MRILYGESRKTKDVFEYTINAGGELQLRVSNGSDRHVRIMFINGKFDRASHDLTGDWIDTRSYWHVMGAIAKQITAIEERFAKAPGDEESK